VWCIRHEAAQRGELPDDAPQPMMPVPWQRTVAGGMGLTQVLVFLNVAVYLAMGISGISISNPPSPALIRWGANYGPLTFSGEWWRLITYNFLHGGLLHIAFNMWCLWDLGALCESLYGTWTFGVLYLISGVAGGLASVGFHPARLSVGASGAIFGLAGALMAGYYFGEFSMPKIMVQARLRSILIFVAYNIVLGGISGSTDNMCHLGGLVAGVICGALIAKAAPSQNDVSARFAILAVAVLALTGTTAALERSRSYIFHTHRGNELLEQNRADDAISELQTAVRERPTYTPARITLADAYYAKEQYSQAESELKQVLEREPQNDDAAYTLGFVYLAEKKTQQAKDTFAQLVTKDDSLPGAHYGLGMALAAEGDHQAAIVQYKRTISMRPQFEGVHYRLGLSEAKLKQYDNAIDAYQQEQQNGDDYDNEVALADAYQAKGLNAQAQEARKKAERLRGK
jgi:membrane associated rhomboid family serine protease/Tfp pilus assembly protein PilF